MLVLISLVAVIGGIGGVALFCRHDYLATVGSAKTELDELTRLMAEHTRAVMVVSSVKLDHIVDLIGDRPPAALRHSTADYERVRAMLSKVPFAQSISVVDENGALVLSSLQPDPPPTNLADREYFRALAAGGPDTFVSPLIWARVSGGLVLSMARRLTDGNGRFRGVVLLTIRAAYFVEFYHEVSRDDRTPFGIYKNDGSVVVEHPLPKRESPRLPLDGPPFTEAAAAPFGTYVADGRLVGYRTEPGYGLVVTAAMPMTRVLADWRRRSLTLAAGLAAGLLLTTGVAALGLAGLRREEAARALIARKAEELAVALADKDVLFQEVHHRVKNNLQVVSSILTMQSLQVADAAARTALQRALDRVHAMGLVHQTLYLRNEASEVEVSTYLDSLARSLEATYDTEGRGIAVHVAADGVVVDLERAVPLGLLVNELMANALKHAFPEGRRGRVAVGLHAAQGGWQLTVEDDGIGLPDLPKGGIGLMLVRGLARQLDGAVETARGETGGTVVRVTFPGVTPTAT
jgi:two-component sensor histidine kinase